MAEAVLEIEVTPNRPDCQSVYGIAREVAAAPACRSRRRRSTSRPSRRSPAAEAIAVEIADPDLCARYGARIVRGVTVGDSPVWLKARLTQAGMRPINNVVDVTNYVMLALGQPLHAFDAAKIRGGKLVARRARAGERIVTLDGIDRVLQPDNLVIADTERALVIAGVFGAIDAEVDEHTTDLVLEAATFNGPNIMRTSKEVGWRSEASTRFEKGLDPWYVPPGLTMAAACSTSSAAAPWRPASSTSGASGPRRRPACCYHPSDSDELLGLAVAPAEQADILRRLECEVRGSEAPADEAGLVVTPPPFRRDLERPVDLIEEIGRIHGLQNLPETLPRRRRGRRAADPRAAGAPGHRRLACRRRSQRGRHLLLHRPRGARQLGLAGGDRRGAPVALINPMSAEQSVMRTLLLPGLLAIVAANLDHQAERVGVFELGRVYLRASGGVPASEDGDVPVRARTGRACAGAGAGPKHTPPP